VKHNLGKKIKLFIFLCSVLLWAEDFTYDFHLERQDPYLKEAVILTLDLNQTNHDIVLMFNFNLQKSDDYFFQRLAAQETDTHHNTQIHYIYLIYPLKSGEIKLSFDLIKKVTTDDSVAYSFSGDRDNIKGLVTTDTKITLPPLLLNVKNLPKNTALVGNFSLTHAFTKHEAKAYEPIPFQIKIEGSGYPPLLDNLLTKELNITVFRENPIVKSTHSKQGTKSSVIYPMALSADKSFTLSPIIVKAFDPKTKKSYELTVPKQYFNISKADVNTLVDKTDDPKPLESDLSWLGTILMTLFSYLIVFAAGYLTAISLKWKKKILPKEENPLKEKIEVSKDEKALLQTLMANDSKKFAASIEILENGLYGKDKINFKKIKQELLEKII
jgi:hypothetical protein